MGGGCAGKDTCTGRDGHTPGSATSPSLGAASQSCPRSVPRSCCSPSRSSSSPPSAPSPPARPRRAAISDPCEVRAAPGPRGARGAAAGPHPPSHSVFSRSLHNAAASRVVYTQPQAGGEKPAEPLWPERPGEAPETLHETLAGRTFTPRPHKISPRNDTRPFALEGLSQGHVGRAEPVSEDGTELHHGMGSLEWPDRGHSRPTAPEPAEEL